MNATTAAKKMTWRVVLNDYWFYFVQSDYDGRLPHIRLVPNNCHIYWYQLKQIYICLGQDFSKWDVGGSSFYVGGMRDTLICDNFLLSKTLKKVFTSLQCLWYLVSRINLELMVTLLLTTNYIYDKYKYILSTTNMVQHNKRSVGRYWPWEWELITLW